MKQLLLIAGAVLALVLGSGAMAAQDDPRLNDLFTQLKRADTPNQVGETELAIWNIWSESGDEAVDSLMLMGAKAMVSRAYGRAMINFNMIVEQRPNFAEGWNKRATLYYLMGDYDASIADVERTLALEPRHFGALSGLGLIHLALDNHKEALDAFEAALKVHPHLQNAQRAVKQLRVKVYGPEI